MVPASVHDRIQGKAASSHLGDVLVLGLGKSGKAAVEYCTNLLGSRVDSVFVAAGQESDAARAYLENLARDGFAYAFGDDGVPTGKTFDICIASPGIPYWHELYQDAEKASTVLMSEMEFAWRESDPRSIWIAITGTNGKTTTSSLCAHILQSCGYKAAAVGNIGDVCLEAVASGDIDVYVAEVSSYQLASTSLFAPEVAVILNITPDHLHWHKTLEAYRDAKFKVLENLDTSAYGLDGEADRASADMQDPAVVPVAVLNATDDVVRARIRELRPLTTEERGFAYIPLGTADGIQGDMRVKCGADNAAFLSETGDLVIAYDGREHDFGPASGLQILGEHNVSNALAAASAALAVGAPASQIATALQTFEPLEHRIEPCGQIDGVLYINDSKGTNVDSVLKALTAFPGKEIVLLLGGEDKGTDLAPLVQATHEHARVAICFGEAGPRFMEAFEAASSQAPASFEYLAAEHLADAFERATQVVRPGEVVLLSPACASFDEFRCFEERGEVFKEMVASAAARMPDAEAAASGTEARA